MFGEEIQGLGFNLKRLYTMPVLLCAGTSVALCGVQPQSMLSVSIASKSLFWKFG
ncbi:hypothetical protein Hanom_Chr07g00582811 [Helianthus anomalus]